MKYYITVIPRFILLYNILSYFLLLVTAKILTYLDFNKIYIDEFPIYAQEITVVMVIAIISVFLVSRLDNIFIKLMEINNLETEYHSESNDKNNKEGNLFLSIIMFLCIIFTIIPSYWLVLQTYIILEFDVKVLNVASLGLYLFVSSGYYKWRDFIAQK